MVVLCGNVVKGIAPGRRIVDNLLCSKGRDPPCRRVMREEVENHLYITTEKADLLGSRDEETFRHAARCSTQDLTPRLFAAANMSKRSCYHWKHHLRKPI